MGSYEYEFKNEHKELKLIEELSKSMRFVSLFLTVLGWLSVLGSLLTGWLDEDLMGAFTPSLPGVAIILIAMWTNNAAKYFNNIIKDEGSDIKNLMQAFKSIRNLYRIKLLLWSLPAIYIILSILSILWSWLLSWVASRLS
jgi:hypothetical protein